MNDPGLEVVSLGVTLASVPDSRSICFVLELWQFGDFFFNLHLFIRSYNDSYFQNRML